MGQPTPIRWEQGAPLPAGWPPTLPELLAAARTRAGAATVLSADGERLDWAALELRSARVAAAWAAQVRPGDRIAIVLPNGVDHLVAELAAWRLGAVAAPLRAGSAELLRRLRPVLTVAARADDAAPVGAWIAPGELRRLAARGPGLDWRVRSPEDPCLILATSGSGGEPRAVVLPERSLCSQQAAFALLWPETGPGDRLAAHLPWHHSFGGLAERLWALCRGAELALIAPERDPGRFAAALRAVRPTLFMSVPRMHRLALQGGAFAAHSLRWTFTAGAVLGAAEEAWYAQHGIRVHEGWGLTETGPSACITPAGEPRTPGCVGRPIPGVAVGVRADGRILVAGPGRMLGYDDDPAATAAMSGDDPEHGPWIDSGDAGEWIAAGLRLGGRADLVIKLENGEKVELGPLAARLEDRPGVRMAVALCRDGRGVEAVLAGIPGEGPAALRAAVAAVNDAEPAHWRRIRAAWALAEEPRVDNGLLTPSHKPARAAWLRAIATGAASPL